MAVDRIDAQANQLDAALVEFRFQLGEQAELGGADRGEILGVREQHRPAISDPVVEFNFALSGFGFEIGGDCAYRKCHGFTSCCSSYREICLRDIGV
jgi:hypothetical protein